MPFSNRPFRRFLVHSSVSDYAGPFQSQGTVWNLSCSGWRLTGDLPRRPGESFSLTVTLPKEQCIEISESRGAMVEGLRDLENLVIKLHTHARLRKYVKRLVREPEEIVQ